MQHKPKFFCETCGREVPVDVDECPYCGMHFYGVMCPRCGKSGPAGLFTEGCPRCGYRSVTGRGGSVNVPILGAGEIQPNLEPEPPVRRTSVWGPLLAVLILATLAGGIIVLLLR